jgi:hypothetical protein
LVLMQLIAILSAVEGFTKGAFAVNTLSANKLSWDAASTTYCGVKCTTSTNHRVAAW